jgi:hypothetical protein
MLGIPADNLFVMEMKNVLTSVGYKILIPQSYMRSIYDDMHQRYVLFLFTMRIRNMRKTCGWLVDITLSSGFQQVCVEFALSKGQILLYLRR